MENLDEKIREGVQKWLNDNNFTKDGYTYIYFPKDSYEVKGELKAAGFTFHKTLMWHRNSAEGFENKIVKVHKSEVTEDSIMGIPCFSETSAQKVQEILRKVRPISASEWAGQPQDKIVDLPVILKSKRGFESRFGWTNIYTFLYNNRDVLVWFTTKDLDVKTDELIYLSATIKELKIFENEKQTVITRAKVKTAK